MEPTTLEDLLPHLVALIIKTKRNKRKQTNRKKNITQKIILYTNSYKDHKLFKQQKTEKTNRKKIYIHKSTTIIITTIYKKPEKKKRSTKMHIIHLHTARYRCC